MQNEFDGYNNMEEQRVDVGQEERKEQSPMPEAPFADLVTPGGREAPDSGNGDEIEETPLPDETTPDDGPDQERVRMEQGGDEKEDDAQGSLLSGDETPRTEQPEILIDIEAEEERARLAERKTRLEKERLDRSRHLQRYYQDQYYLEHYYMDQGAGATAHTVDGVTVYEDESVSSGNASYREGSISGKKVKADTDAFPMRSREKPESAGQKKSAGVEEAERHGQEPAGGRPGHEAAKKGAAPGSGKKVIRSTPGSLPEEITTEEAAAKKTPPGYGIIQNCGLTEIRGAGPGTAVMPAAARQGILEAGRCAAGVEPARSEKRHGHDAKDLEKQGGAETSIQKRLFSKSRLMPFGKTDAQESEKEDGSASLSGNCLPSGNKKAGKGKRTGQEGIKRRGEGILSKFAEKAGEEITARMEEEAAKSAGVQAVQISHATQPGTLTFMTKMKAAAKAFVKKAAAGTLAGILATAAIGGYNAVNGGTSSWYPLQAHVTTDGSDAGTSLTQDVFSKMFARLGAYGINTSYNTSSATGPLTIHIPGYEQGGGNVRWGDSQIILTGSGGCILIDGGCGILSDMTLEYLSQKGVRQLTAIITHWHGDHYTAVDRILSSGDIHVEALYCPPPGEIASYDPAESATGSRICRAAENQGGKVVYPESGRTSVFNIYGVSIEIWREAARGARDSETAVNDSSMQIYFPDLYYLTTGDMVYSLPRYLETMEGRTIKFFEIPHHGNGSRLAMERLKEYGAEVCWYNNLEPDGNMYMTGYSAGAIAARNAGFEIFRTMGDIEITAGGGIVNISGNGKHYSYSCPYNPGGGSVGNRDLVSYAKQWVGKIPYKSSVTNNDPDNERFQPLAAGRGSDCSWFVFHCLEHFGILDEFVHSYEWGTEPDRYPGGMDVGTDLGLALPGDILCYAYGSGKSGNRNSGNSHVGIYTGDGKQVECAAGHGVIESEVDKKNLIQIVRFGSAVPSVTYTAYTGEDTKTRHGFSTQTEAIVEQHMNDFNYDSFSSFMAARGGTGSYIRSLGGVFAKWYGRDAKVQTAGEFQEIAEYVMGIYTIWGPDYHGGGGTHRFNGDYGSGDEYGRFYTGGENYRWWVTTPIEEDFVNNRERVMTDCGCGIYHIMQKAGLMDCYAGMQTVGDAERYLENHGCYAQGGKIITRREDLQVGDLVQMIKAEDHKWHHVAVVGEIYADGRIILYDTGNRYVNTSNYKKEFITDSAGVHGVYEGYESWFGVRVRQISQTGGITDGMAVQDLKEIRIASVTVDGDPVDKSGFSYGNLRDFSRGGKVTSSVMAKFRFVDENGDEIQASPVMASISPVSRAGATSVSGTEIVIPEGLGSVHTFMGWQCITSTTSNQYRLRQEAGENYDSEGFAIIDGRYVIACTTTFGNVGDYVDFYQEDGLVFHCIIGEIKSRKDAGCTEWGHNNGHCIIEFVVDRDSWYPSHENPGTPSCHPEWAVNLVKAVNIGPRSGGPSTMQAATMQGQYDMQCLELAKQVLSMSAAGSYYKNPVSITDYDWYCFDLIDYAVCEYHGADVEYRTVGETYVCTVTITVCCNLLELEKGDKNFTSWETGLKHGDLIPLSYMSLSKTDYEDIFNVDLTMPARLSQVVFSGVEQEVYSFFLAKGLGAPQIAGIMANIKAESGFDPAAQDGNGACGLFQWTGGRFRGLKDYAASKGKDWADVQVQLEYAWREIDSDEGWNGNAAQRRQFMETSSAFQAAVLFCSYWERCGTAGAAAKRGRYAQEYYSKIMSAGQGSNIDYVQWAVSIANDDSHGYSQDRRGGNPDFDCASLVFYALKNAGYDVGGSPFSTYTMDGVLTRCGFRRIPISSASEMMPGDILWKQTHTEIYVGDGKSVGAHCDENGGIHGRISGDQTGHEIDVGDVGTWHYVYRRAG